MVSALFILASALMSVALVARIVIDIRDRRRQRQEWER